MGNNRLINFCHPKLCSKISCNTCCSENYEETNLLSSDPAKFRRGFMADSFIKPPVEIHVTFKYSVNLSYILLWPRVGQQKSSGFEITSNFSDGSSTTSERIGSCYLSECEEGVFFFCPLKFGRGKSHNACPEQPKFVERSFSWHKLPAISDVTSITVRIVRTNSSSVPALSRIEIWGQPGFRTTAHEKKDIWSLWELRLNENKTQLKHDPIPQQLSAKPGTSEESTLTSTSLDIPEEFLDGLTFEMMSVPMVLPSGKVVDQRTLERHQDSEANWGRLPSDPFTGRPFTATLHPILDTALKSRIDHFLVVHQDNEELRFVPRTLGRKHQSNTAKNQINVSATQKEKSAAIPKSQNDQICSTRCQKHNLSQCTSCVQNISSLVKDFKSCQSSKNLPNEFPVTPNEKIYSSSRKRSCSPEVTILSESVSRNKSLNMGNNRPGTVLKLNSSCPQKDDDLDDDVRAVLSGLPSFVNIDKTQQTTPDNCCECKNRDNLFKLPCTHLVCRVCLLEKIKSAQPSCSLCRSNFTSNQPIKYHPV